jgi:pimeloyl-ACP methyl ester carboxylesterase
MRELRRLYGSRDAMTTKLMHRSCETNGIHTHFAEAGTGPLVMLCHGFPESWYSWRHQLTALAEAGFRVVAPDMRGYGRTDQPSEIDQYTLLHSIGDMVGLLDALGVEQAVIVGHDWGAPLAWGAAVLRPDRFRGVIALSGPFGSRGPNRPTTVMPQSADILFYQLYFQTPGVAEAEFERDVRLTVRTILYSISGDAPRLVGSVVDRDAVGMVRRGGGFLDQMLNPNSPPPWLSEADVDFYATEFARTGFRGGLNWYRNIDRNWELFAPFAGAKVSVPALYIAGERDVVLDFPGIRERIPNMVQFVPQLRGTIMLPGCGHWTQQERSTEVNAAMIDFLRGLPRERVV